MLVRHLFHQRGHLLGGGGRGGGVAHGLLDELRLHVEVLELPLELIHVLRHLLEVEVLEGLSRLLTMPAMFLFTLFIFAWVSRRDTTPSSRDASFSMLSCSFFLRMASVAWILAPVNVPLLDGRLHLRLELLLLLRALVRRARSSFAVNFKLKIWSRSWSSLVLNQLLKSPISAAALFAFASLFERGGTPVRDARVGRRDTRGASASKSRWARGWRATEARLPSRSRGVARRRLTHSARASAGGNPVLSRHRNEKTTRGPFFANVHSRGRTTVANSLGVLARATTTRGC